MKDSPIILHVGKVKYVHVSQPAIRANIHAKNKQPALVVKCGGKSYYGNRIQVEAGDFLYNAEKPILSCGARVVFKTRGQIKIFD